MSGASFPAPLPLCRQDGHTCGACCWGESVTRFRLTGQLRRQTRLFRSRFNSDRLPGRRDLLHYELAARRGLDCLLSLLLLVPGLGDWLRPRLQRRMICAFLGFEDSQQQRVGCLLHPSRWNGQDIRSEAAFALLSGFGCGSSDYYCLAAHWFAAAGWKEKRDFSNRTASLDWYRYSRAASTYGQIKRPGCAS